MTMTSFTRWKWFAAGLLTLLGVAVGQSPERIDYPYIINGLVGFYPFNGSATNQYGPASSGVIQMGGAVGATNRFGDTNAALHFDGSGYVSITPTPVNLSSNWTISFWAKTDTMPVNYPYLVSSGWDANGGLNLSYRADIQGWGTLVGLTVAAQGGNGASATRWNQLTFIHSAGAYSVFVNGQLAGTNATPVGNPTDTGTLWIGRHQVPIANGLYPYLGELDEIRIYNRALSLDEVESLFVYDSNPTSRPPNRAATGVAISTNGFVIGVNVIDPGYGYTNTPAVLLVGGGGTGAKAVATVQNGMVSQVSIIDAGSGYTNAPTVVFDSPPLPPSQATAIAKVTNGFVTDATLTSGGYLYSAPPAVFFLGGGGAGATATATISDGVVTGIKILSAGTGYATAPTVLIAAPTGSPRLEVSVSQVNLRLTLVPGFYFKVQSSSDFSTWMDVVPTFLATVSETNLLQEVVGNATYFRLVEAP